MKKKLTVIMPVYNRVQYLQQAIDSVLSQRTNFNFELRIYDDGSTDGSTTVCENAVKLNPGKVCLNHNETNQGLFFNIMKAHTEVDSEYFCVIDPDDYYLDKEFFQKAIDYLTENPTFTCYGANTLLVDNDTGEEKGVYLPKANIIETDIYDWNKRGRITPHTSSSVYRNVIYSQGIPKYINDIMYTASRESFRADSARFIMHLEKGSAFISNDVVSTYRIHSDGIWSGSTEFHRMILGLRGLIDLKNYFDGRADNIFEPLILKQYDAINKSVFLNGLTGNAGVLSENDIENYRWCNNYIVESNLQNHKKSDCFSIKDELIKMNHAKRFYIWGTGKATQRLLNEWELSQDQIIAYIDNDRAKSGMMIDGKRVICPDELLLSDEYILIMSSYYEEIKKQIVEQEITDSEHIVNIYKLDALL